ncbi:DNA-directed RNA polymerase subunit alpha C-terminal domain-containing protein [Butyrivibrio proteoclasticus]|uniref:DNA-directed RNA polymerase subunit alpha C-terminal domain-containing protein n=1 Tax=Butyrivibrio proteoclasticus TaxID=43305 RepID=UPI0004798B16|nr:DNA-directed RNA polymerase subunit alpha C-terminal domain-containing protein [Butyrivibrio proteoclasticus]
MSENQSLALSQIIEQITGDRVHEKKGGKFFFNIYLNSKMSETPIETLELGVRAYNSLKRAGYSTIGELAEAISSGTEISKIRNCGAKSCREIMEKLFLYQYSALPQEKRVGYVKEVVELNAARKKTS